MNNKGASIIMMIFEIIVVLTVVMMMVSVATSFAEDDMIIKIRIAEDLALMVDTLVGVPGDALILYEKNVSKYNLLLKGESITIMKPGDNDFSKAVRKIRLPAGYTAISVVEQQETVCMEKGGIHFFIRPCNVSEVTYE
jgi:hypothetical protein